MEIVKNSIHKQTLQFQQFLSFVGQMPGGFPAKK